jgi:hypothetical protein
MAMSVGSASLSAFVSNVDLANGDDPAALLDAIQALRAGNITQAATDAQKALAALMQRLKAIVAANFAARLQAMPDTPDGTGKILGDLSAGQPIRSLSPELGTALPADADSLGLDALPTQNWLMVTSQTRDASGNVISNGTTVLDSPDQVAAIRRNYPQATSGDVDEYVMSTSGSGANARTTYLQVHNTQGQVRASDTDIAQFLANVSATVAQLQTGIADGQHYLVAVLHGMTQTLAQDKDVADPAKQDIARSQQRHFDELMRSLGEPSATAGA